MEQIENFVGVSQIISILEIYGFYYSLPANKRRAIAIENVPN
jgi:hypothetical protein